MRCAADSIVQQVRLRGEVVGPLVAGLMLAKALVWAIALGSGTSGACLRRS
jgi:hypothetical protein